MAKINIASTRLPGVVIVEPTVFGDARGFLMETFHKAEFQAAGIDLEFVQDNHSLSAQGTLRGLHFQVRQAQAKLVRVVRGEAFDVVVDVRIGSSTFGQWVGVHLSAANKRQVFMPQGMAHGFCTLEDNTEVLYKCSDYYAPQHERTLLWNDPVLAIDWPLREPILSEKDKRGLTLAELFSPETRGAGGTFR